MRRVFSGCAVVLLLLLGLLVAPTAGAAPRLPDKMASIGDSITRAANVCCWYGDHPASSWSTGGAGWDGVRSHYERLRALNPDIAGRNHNLAVSGARMSDGPRQARAAVDRAVHYVTIELGANDVCTASPSSMTSVEEFRTQFEQTLKILIGGLPSRARIFVASIPDVHHLWELYRDSDTARWVWDLANICQALLAPSRTDAERQLVKERNVAFNDVLSDVCGQYRRCRYDGGAVYGYQFQKQDVSNLDYFHPSLSGQADLASVSWARSWWSG